MMQAKQQSLLPFGPDTLRSYQLGIIKVTEFGVLKSVTHNDEGWVTITSEDGHVVQMKKIYAGWLSVYLKAQKMIGRRIVYETGSSASAADFFRDIYEESPDKPLLSFPDDAGPAAQAQIIIARLSASRWRWNTEKAETTADERAEEIERQSVALTLLEKQDYDEIKIATEALDNEWPEWKANRRRKLLLQGAANHGGKIQNLDRKFMLRLGIDTSRMRNIPIEMIGRGNNNYVRVRLPTFDNMECEVGLKKSTQRGTQGQWGVCTVKNEYDSWFKLEGKHYPNAKTLRWSLDKMKEAHNELMSMLVVEEQAKLDVAFDQIGDVQVITA